MSLSQWFSDLENEAKAKLAELGEKAEEIAEYVGPVVVDDIESALEELGTLALDAVVAEAPKLISGQEKFSNAVTDVVQNVEAQGKPVLVQDAQMAVQGAYHAFQIAVSTPAG
jgi:hypothetical protein